MATVIEAGAAAQLIRDGDCVFFGGSGGGHVVPEAVIEALGDRYRQTASPIGITAASVVSIGDWETTGFNHLALPGLLKRVVTAGFNNCPKIAALAIDDEIEAYTLPQGVLSQLTRDMAAGRPGLVTRTGLHTFIDPRHGGGKQSRRTTEDLVELVTIGGEEYLLFRSFAVNVAVIRGTTADEDGNVSMEEEAYVGENFSIAAAARRNGGIVIAQVKRLAAAGTLAGRDVRVPKALVDYVVVAPDQLQTYGTAYSPAYAGRLRVPDRDIRPIPFDVRKVMARRGAMELFPGAVVNLGFGVSNGISAVAAEEGFYRDLTLTVEQGVIGGIPAVGKDAGAGVNFDMLAAQPDQFDFYDGGGLDIAFLSFAEVDEDGNVNVSRYHRSINGPGGFINISQGAQRVVFSGTLTTGGLDAAPDGRGALTIRREGEVRKWVPRVGQLTFSGRYARERGQEVLFITERAVFRLEPDGIVLAEIAPGVDLASQVLAHIGFRPRIADDLRAMDGRLFTEQRMGLRADFLSRAGRASAAS